MYDAGNNRDVRWMFREIVLPNYRDFLAEPLSLRLAFNAAVSITHLPDFLAASSAASKKEERRRERSFREKFRKNQDFVVVESMANSIKHVHADRGGEANPISGTIDGARIAEVSVPLFSDNVEGKPRDFFPTREMLVFDYQKGGKHRPAWAATTLYGAIIFIAREIGCASYVTADDLPPKVDFLYRCAL